MHNFREKFQHFFSKIIYSLNREILGKSYTTKDEYKKCNHLNIIDELFTNFILILTVQNV